MRWKIEALWVLGAEGVLLSLVMFLAKLQYKEEEEEDL